MTLETLIDRVRKRSRTRSDYVGDNDIQNRIDESIKKFAKDTQGLVKDAYLPLTPKFDMFTHHAFNLTIVGGTNALSATDIPVTDSNATDQTGTQAATELQERIRAAGPTTLTVAWSTSTFKFTIDAIDSTSITIAAPDGDNYSDITDLFFGKSGTQSSTSWVSDVPQDVMLEVDLPSDFLYEKAVEWDRNPLAQGSFDMFISPQASGTPKYYYIINKKLRINAVPTSQKLLHIFYYYLPTTLGQTAAYQECGLTGKTGSTATGLSTTTQYYFKVNIDGGGVTEYDITTAADVTYTAVMALMNAEISGASFGLSSGDLRCTSDSTGAESSIALSAGTTGTDLFATLTDFSAFDTAYSELQDEITIENEIEDAIIYYATSLVCEDDGNLAQASYFRLRYNEIKNTYKANHANQNPKYRNYDKNIIEQEYRVIT